MTAYIRGPLALLAADGLIASFTDPKMGYVLKSRIEGAGRKQIPLSRRAAEETEGS